MSIRSMSEKEIDAYTLANPHISDEIAEQMDARLEQLKKEKTLGIKAATQPGKTVENICKPTIEEINSLSPDMAITFLSSVKSQALNQEQIIALGKKIGLTPDEIVDCLKNK